MYDPTAASGGSISAEHGLGHAERDVVAGCRSGLELELVRGVEQPSDLAGLMDPGEVLPG